MKHPVQKPRDEASAGMKKRMLLITSVMLMVMTAFESLKQLIFPGITVWESHIITILFSTGVAAAVGYAVIRKSQPLYERISEEIRIRRESEEKLRTIITNIPDVMWTSDSNGKTVFISPNFEHVSGYPVSEVYEKSAGFWFAGIHPDDVESVKRAYEELIARNVMFDIEYRFRKKDGTWMWVHDRAVTTYEKDGMLYVDGMFTDVTGRRRAMEELTRSRERLAKAQDIARFGDWEWDIGENVVTYSDEIYRIFGMDRHASFTTYEQFLDVVHPEDRDLVARSVQAAVYEGKPYSIDHRVVWPGGAVHIVHEEGEVLRDDTGRPVKMVGTAHDITERKLAENEIRRLNTELERKVEERTGQLIEAQEELVRKEKLSILGQLSGSVGHELRNPLGVMSNAVYFLKMVQSDGDETVREYLGIIENEINNAQRIISDLLDFARTKPPQVQPVAVEELVRQNLGKYAVPENVTVTVDIPEALPRLKVDPLQMGQVLVNFITNAVQAMPGGGALRISAHRLSSECGMRNAELKTQAKDSALRTPHSEFDGDFVEISVEDTGEGISPENMKKLFQPLFTTKPRGIGLGLVVCRNLTEANSGRIEVESELGKGTTFTVILPVEEKQQ